MKFRKTDLAICALLAALVFAVYGQTAGHAFVNYDDEGYLTDNFMVQRGVTWAGLKWAFTSTLTANWHPVTWISLMIDCQLFGLNPGPHHLVSVGIHAATSVLLFLAWRHMTRCRCEDHRPAADATNSQLKAGFARPSSPAFAELRRGRQLST